MRGHESIPPGVLFRLFPLLLLLAGGCGGGAGAGAGGGSGGGGGSGNATPTSSPAISQTDVTQGSIRVWWNPSTGFARYGISRADAGSATFSRVGETTQASWDDSLIEPGYGYDYRVTGVTPLAQEVAPGPVTSVRSRGSFNGPILGQLQNTAGIAQPITSSVDEWIPLARTSGQHVVITPGAILVVDNFGSLIRSVALVSEPSISRLSDGSYLLVFQGVSPSYVYKYLHIDNAGNWQTTSPAPVPWPAAWGSYYSSRGYLLPAIDGDPLLVIDGPGLTFILSARFSPTAGWYAMSLQPGDLPGIAAFLPWNNKWCLGEVYGDRAHLIDWPNGAPARLQRWTASQGWLLDGLTLPATVTSTNMIGTVQCQDGTAIVFNKERRDSNWTGPGAFVIQASVQSVPPAAFLDAAPTCQDSEVWKIPHPHAGIGSWFGVLRDGPGQTVEAVWVKREGPSGVGMVPYLVSSKRIGISLQESGRTRLLNEVVAGYGNIADHYRTHMVLRDAAGRTLLVFSSGSPHGPLPSLGTLQDSRLQYIGTAASPADLRPVTDSFCPVGILTGTGTFLIMAAARVGVNSDWALASAPVTY